MTRENNRVIKACDEVDRPTIQWSSDRVHYTALLNENDVDQVVQTQDEASQCVTCPSI